MQVMTVLTLAEGAARGIQPAAAGWARLTELHASWQEPSAEEWTELHRTAIETRAEIQAREASWSEAAERGAQADLAAAAAAPAEEPAAAPGAADKAAETAA